jgi:3-deoxy-D-manno-octulosonic-acid transferase
MEKQMDLVNRFLANQAAQEVDKVEDLADLLEHLFSDPIARADWQDRAVQVVRNEARVLALYLEALIPHLPQPESPASKVQHLSLASSARP